MARSAGSSPSRPSDRPPSAALRIFVRVVVVLGAAAVAQSAVMLLRAPRPIEWFLFAALAILTGSFTIKIASVSASISVSDTFFITLALLFGPAPATIAIAIDSCIMSWRRGHRRQRVVFNAAAPAAAMWLSAQAFFLLARVQPLAHSSTGVAPLILPLLALAALYFALNSGLMAIAVGLESRQSPIQVWCRHFRWLSIGYLASGSLAFCLVLLIQQVGLLSAVVILPLLAVFHLTLRASFGRLDDARQHLGDMDRLYLSTVETLAMAIDAKDDVTHSHVRRVQAYALALARALGIVDEPSLKAIEAAALLHDTGKLAVPEHILNKPGGLTPSEFDQMKLHVDVGADILSLVNFPYPVVPIVRCHHENWDGTGYPRGVKGADIPIGARILSVVDCFDALTSDRPYRRRMTDDAALAILRERRGRMYDPQVVDVFMTIYRDVALGDVETPEQRDVMAQIGKSRQTAAVAELPPSAGDGASSDVLAFVSLARLASGDVSVTDVLALASNLIRDVTPRVTGAWYVPDSDSGRLVVVDAFGPAAHLLKGTSMAVGERLTGWVAANRQAVINSDAALDLGERAHQMPDPLLRCMSVPLMAGDSLAAVLSLYGGNAEIFTDDRGRLIQMIAPHVAGAIQSARNPTAEKPAASPIDKPPPGLRLVAAR